MSAGERDFATFHLGDNVYELAGGVIPEIAERLDVRLGQEPNSGDIQEIVSQLGENKVLRDNQEVTAITREEMADLADVSGIQKPLRRSLRTPAVGIEFRGVDALTIMGGMANWQDRAAAAVPEDLAGTPVYTIGGKRVMDSGTEVSNPNVAGLAKRSGGYPTEAQYMTKVINPVLRRAGHLVIAQEPGQYKSDNGDTLLAEFFQNNPALTDQRLAMVRVANAGVIMAIQMRDAARKFNSDFDAGDTRAQTFVITDTLPVSRTEEQDAQPTQYQKANNALRQLVLTAKKLHEAAGGE